MRRPSSSSSARVIARVLARVAPLALALAACAADRAREGAAPVTLSERAPLPVPAQVADPACDAGYLEDFELWREVRESSLTSPESYLALAGMYWLDEGDNAFGSDPACDLVLPEGRAPARVGTLRLIDGIVSLTVEPHVLVTHRGEPVQELTLAPDSSETLHVGELTFWIIDRAGQVGLRLRDPESPILLAYDHTPTWPPRDAWRVPARFDAYPVPRMVRVPNVLGSYYEQESPGVLRFEMDGVAHSLVVTGGGPSLNLVFGDATNGRGSYVGGRFLRVDAPDEDGRTVIDFNRAYNPPCAYSPYTTCPMPPPGNELPFAVTAGERDV